MTQSSRTEAALAAAQGHVEAALAELGQPLDIPEHRNTHLLSCQHRLVGVRMRLVALLDKLKGDP